MTPENKIIWQMRLATLFIFILGFIAGGFAVNSYWIKFADSRLPTKQERYEEAFNQLNLTETQTIEVQKIVGEIRENIQSLRQESEPRLQEIRTCNDAKLQKVLSNEQWAKFQALRENIRQKGN